MRDVPTAMTTTWKSGVFTGPNRAIARVTVQQTQIRASDYLAQRFAWYLFGNPSEVVELPNVKSVKWTRSVDSDAGTCDIELYNTHELPIGVAPDTNDYVYNQPGFFTFSRGDLPNRWNHVANSFTHRLYPDMLIRTYEGYGYDPTVGPELDTHMMPSGVWLIDDVILGADAMITLKCRDAARLLLDQIAFPPVVPSGLYPLKFEHFTDVANPQVPVISGGGHWINPHFDTDSSAPYGGPNLSINGHRAADAFDVSDTTYWLSIGNGSPTASYAYEWIQGKLLTPQTVGAVRIFVRGGPYRVYVSLHTTDHGWVGKSTIPYDPDAAPSAPNGSNIRFIASATVPANLDTTIDVKDTPNVDKIRFTFHDLWDSSYDPTHQGLKYRAAVRDVDVFIGTTTTTWVDGGTHINGNYADYCLQQDHEVLTRRGWLRYDEVREGDEAFSIDPLTGLSEWDRVTGVFREHRQRTMISMQSQTHSSVSTPDHRWLTKSASSGDLRFRTTEQLNANDRIPVAAPRADAPLSQMYPDEFVELMAWWWTEGSFRSTGSGQIGQSHRVNPEYVDRIRNCLAKLYAAPGPMRRSARVHPEIVERARSLRALGHTHHATGKLLGISGKTVKSWEAKGWPVWALWNETYNEDRGMTFFNLSQQLVQDLSAVGGRVPAVDFLASLTQSQLDLYIETSIDADGSRSNGRVVLAQRSEDRIKSFEAACALAGRPTITHFNEANMWSTTLRRGAVVCPSACERKEIEYDGIIWCPTMAKNHTFLARHDGAVYFTGNTDIVKWLLGYAGFLWPSAPTLDYQMTTAGKVIMSPPTPDDVLWGLNADALATLLATGRAPIGEIWGDIEQSGTYGPSDLTTDIFDKKSLMDGVAYIRDILGFIFYIDETGAAVFRSPNIWSTGNNVSHAGHRLTTDATRDADPTHIVNIDESQTLMALQATLTGRNIRERVVVANVAGNFGAVTKGFLPYHLPPAGLRRVAIWSDQFFESNSECQIMADLIAVRQLFTYRTDTITIPGYPALQIDDQVHLTESTTEEVGDLHYIKGITSSLDMSTGDWTYALDVHWLGNDPFVNWAFNPADLADDTQIYLQALGKIT